MLSHLTRVYGPTCMLGVLAAAALLWAPLASAENASVPWGDEPSAARLGGAAQGADDRRRHDVRKGERAAMVEQQHQRIMEHMSQDPQVQGVNTGMYNTSAMMHQYGAGGQDMLLMSDPRVEPVAMTGGGKCPATAPVKQYNVSAINVEITLNQWLDFYPGYMYVLDENLERSARKKPRTRKPATRKAIDPGAVIPACRLSGFSRWSSAATRAIASRSSSRNKLEGGEDGQPAHPRLQHGRERHRQPRRRRRTPTPSSPRTRAGEFEWYIHPSTQEGVRQFHTYSNDRELTVMGLFGAFVVEPRGSRYLEPLGTGDPTPATSGWQAIIKNGTGPDFREFVLIYHEVGDEAFRPLNKKGDFLPQRDPLTDAYRPVAARSIIAASRSASTTCICSTSISGSKTSRWAIAPIRSAIRPRRFPARYMGDPAKFRLVHGGSEVFHSPPSARWNHSLAAQPAGDR